MGEDPEAVCGLSGKHHTTILSAFNDLDLGIYVHLGTSASLKHH